MKELKKKVDSVVSKGKYQQILKGTVARGSTSVVGFTCFFWDVPKS